MFLTHQFRSSPSARVLHKELEQYDHLKEQGDPFHPNLNLLVRVLKYEKVEEKNTVTA